MIASSISPVRIIQVREGRRLRGYAWGPVGSRSARQIEDARVILRRDRIDRGKQIVAFGAVDGAELLRSERGGRPVVDDPAGLEPDGARAIAQRVFDLMQRDKNGDAVPPI